MSDLIRAFFAVDLSFECKQRLEELMAALKPHLKKNIRRHHPFRWVQARNLHLTLQFLGQLPEEALAPLMQTARKELSGLKSFSLRLGPLEWFPSSYVPHVLSMQAGPLGSLTTLAEGLARAAVAEGYKIDDRPFRPHLTLARIEGLKNLEPIILEDFHFDPLPEILVPEVVLFRSDMQAGGSVYTPLANIKLES